MSSSDYIKPMFVLPDPSSPQANVYALIRDARDSLRAQGVAEEAINSFEAEMTAHDYDHALQTLATWFSLVKEQPSYVPTSIEEFTSR